MAKTADPAELLAHADWLRDLARKLVGGADADDAVQETYVAALRSPPDPDLPAKPWLARVLRNASRMTHRSTMRRTRREDAVSATAPPASSVADTVARAEMFRTLVELVLALDEPYRATLLHHYFDGETFAAIARRAGIPEATVRGRHKQALDQLRRRLDARSHGDRRAWLASLAPLATPPAHTASLTAGVLIVKKLVIAAVAILVGGLIWHWAPRRSAHATAPAGLATVQNTTEHPSGVVAAPVGPELPPPQHVRKLASAAEREALAKQIAAAHQKRVAARAQQHDSTGALSASEGPGSGSATDLVDKDVIRGAMREVLPFLTDCYADARGGALSVDHIEVRAHFTLTGDPDVGTVIDAKELIEANKQKLPAAFDDCVRSTIQTLELPPLGDGDTVEVDYPLVFSDGPPPDGSGGSAH